MESQENKSVVAEPREEVQAEEVQAVEVLDLDDDLDTGMHRVNVCKTAI